MEIQVKSSIMARPAQNAPSRTMWISNLDVVASRKHVPLVYFYKPINGCESFFDTRVLTDSLSKVLVSFYPLAGRLGWNPNGRIQVNCNGEGVLFVEAYATCAVSDLADFKALVPVVDYSTAISSYPLVLLQVTFFKCGGVCLGAGIHHTLVDGNSFLHFINSWAEVTRGLSISEQPIFDHHLLRARVPPTPSLRHTEFDPSLSVYKPKQSHALRPMSVSISPTVLKITPHQLNTLRANAKSNSSTYSILAAHIWRCMCKACDICDDEVTNLYFPVSGRSRLNPHLPPGYFGNVIVKARIPSLAGDIQYGPLIQTVERIIQTTKRMDDAYFRSLIDYLEEQDDLNLVYATYGSNFTYPNFHVVSWVGLPLYDADFGWGRPNYLGLASMYFEGAVFILPSPLNDGSFLLIIGMEGDRIKLFEKYFYYECDVTHTSSNL